MSNSQRLVNQVHPLVQRTIRRRLPLLQIARAVERVTGRRISIEVCPQLARSRTTGAWAQTSRLDIILVIPTRSALHHCQIVLHELAHILMDHVGIVTPRTELATVEGIDGTIRACRGGRDDDVEVAAEVIADALFQSSGVLRTAERFAREFG